MFCPSMCYRKLHKFIYNPTLIIILLCVSVYITTDRRIISNSDVASDVQMLPFRGFYKHIMKGNILYPF